MNAAEREELKAKINAACRVRIDLRCPSGYAKGTTGYRNGCRCPKCRQEAITARNERRYRDGSRQKAAA